MATKQVTAGTLQKGSYVVIDNAPCKVVEIQVSKPGKHGHSKVRIAGVGIIDDKKRVTVMPGQDNIDVPIVEKKNAQVLSITGEMVNVMDSETFETFDLKIPEELKAQVVEGCTVVYWEIMADKIMKQIKGA